MLKNKLDKIRNDLFNKWYHKEFSRKEVYIAINKYSVAPAVLQLIPKDVAQREKVIALDRIGDVLSVVMTNPLDEQERERLEKLTKCSIATFISTKSEIEEAIARLY